MKLTTEQIKQMIKEELSGVLKESDMGFYIEKLEPLLLDKNSLFGNSPSFAQGVSFLEMLDDPETGAPGIANEILGNLIGKVDRMIQTIQQERAEMRKTSLSDPYQQELREKEIYAKGIESMHLHMKRDELENLMKKFGE